MIYYDPTAFFRLQNPKMYSVFYFCQVTEKMFIVHRYAGRYSMKI